MRPNNSPRSNPPQRPKCRRPAILNDEIGIGRHALDGDVADHVAGGGSGRAKRQAHGVARQVACQQQVSLGLMAIEQRALGQLVEIAGENGLGAGRFAPDPHLGQARDEHLEADSAAFDALLGDLDRGDVASIAQDRCRAVSDLAHGRDRDVLADIGGIARRQVGTDEPLRCLELGAAQHEVDRAEFRTVESTGSALDPAFDLQSALRWLGRRRLPGHFLAGWRRQGAGDLGRGRAGITRHQHAKCEAGRASRRVYRFLYWPPTDLHSGCPFPARMIQVASKKHLVLQQFTLRSPTEN